MESHWYFWGLDSTDRDHCVSMELAVEFKKYRISFAQKLVLSMDTLYDKDYFLTLFPFIMFSLKWPHKTHLNKQCPPRLPLS